ncbi:hypothetical protein TEA_008973 [Camellia sinensis var. sinensis]|uniref:CAAX prenyl protease 2/Lysostaphin resistance protein A-like domain-containing protein n=1 Tax=Camellia sinensis var. sinensis TaxID=542762 RepID=A0A4S4EHI0_CAMSN|nr:hypothetical protein TEA_008973 [Camellia sinensis var. sinensis]
MEFPLISRAPNPPTTSFCSARVGLCDLTLKKKTKTKKRVVSVRGSAERSGEGGGEREGRGGGGGYTSSAMEVTTFNRGFGEAEFPVWEKIGVVVRLSYGIGIYGAMGLAGRFICSMTGIDCLGGFYPSLDAIVEGLGYAAPPIMALLFILDDEVVKLSPHARAIRDVEDEELRSFFYGMSPWQFVLIVAASSVGEELFYRAAVQGALAEIFLRSTDLVTDARGMASLTGVLPSFVPFAQAFAAVITAALTGSLYYVAASPKDPTYVVAPVLQSRSGREDLKKLFAAWYEKRQLKKIYSPLLEGLLALYLGFEWIQTNNILAPIITHGIYSAVILGHGLWKIHDHRHRLHQRIQQLKREGKNYGSSPTAVQLPLVLR